MTTEACTQSPQDTWHTSGLDASCIQVSGWLHSILSLVSLEEGVEAWEETTAAMVCKLYLNKAGLKKKLEKQLPKVSGNTQAKLEHRAESVHSLPPLPLGATAPEVPSVWKWSKL